MASQSERLYVVRSGAAANTSVAVALAAATAKTVIGVIGSSTDTLCLKGVSISFDSVTGTAVPAVVEVGIITAAGTVGTAFTPVQVTGSPLASSSSAGYNHSAEPTYNRIFDTRYVPVNNGTIEWYYPLGEEPLAAISQGFAVRITSPSAVNCLPRLTFSE